MARSLNRQASLYEQETKVSNNSKNAARSIFESSQRALAELGAVVVTFFLAPITFDHTKGWVLEYTLHYYGADFVGVIYFAWMAIVGAVIFFTSRITVTTCLMMGGTAIIMRFLT